MDHLEFDQLLALAETSGSAALRSLEANLLADPAQLRKVYDYLRIKQVVATDDGVEPTAAALARALALFRAQSASSAENWWARAERFIAQLVFDSRVQTAGLRFSPGASTVNLAFESDRAAVDLQIDRIPQSASQPATAARSRRLMGQVGVSATTDFPDEISVVLTSPGQLHPLYRTATDEHGGFAVLAEPGRYDLHLDLPDGVLVLPDIDMT